MYPCLCAQHVLINEAEGRRPKAVGRWSHLSQKSDRVDCFWIVEIRRVLQKTAKRVAIVFA